MKIYFIGIGGIGVSALARFYFEKGWEVSGSDLEASEITRDLENLGVKISIGPHRAKFVRSNLTDLVIYSLAVQENNPELKKARKLGIKCQSYPEALGQLTKKYFTIAISGTHGKSTTCALISLILIRAGLDPTCIVGTKLREFGNSNFRMGKSPEGKPSASYGASKYFVIEADEWQASFLNYWPKIIVLTNIEKEHLDYYKDLDHILKTYKKYISHLQKDGILVINQDDPNILRLFNLISNTFLTIVQNVLYFSLREKEVKKIKKILKIPGIHNISNALAALKVARILKIPDKISYQALSEYQGAWRRFEIVEADLRGYPGGLRRKSIIISDYAHHPTEIKATLAAAREKFKKRKIWAIFQPHQYQRTYFLFDDFITAFDLADEIVLTKIYDVAGREEKKISGKVSSKKLAQKIKERGKKVHFVGNFRQIPQFLKKRLKSNDVILIMGAGDIYKLVNFF